MRILFFAFLFFLSTGNSFSKNPDYRPVVSHDIWDRLLQEYVSADGKVDYHGLLESRTVLKQYLDQLSNNAPAADWPPNETMAYWINAYNAFTIELILDHYPVKSIKEIDAGKPWDEKFIDIGGVHYSLNDIETVLRKKFADPRIHFALNCASKSCPALLNGAYLPAKLDEQLDMQARRFVNDTSHNLLSNGKIAVSPIFDWYKQDFSGGVVSFINRYSRIKVAADAPVAFLNYDWTLNE